LIKKKNVIHIQQCKIEITLPYGMFTIFIDLHLIASPVKATYFKRVINPLRICNRNSCL